MMTVRTAIIALAAVVLSASTAFADIRVTTTKNTPDARRMVTYIESLGERYLKPGQDLKIQILDYRAGIGRDPWFDRPFGHRPGWYGHPYGRRRDPFFDFDRFDRSREARLKVSYSLSEKGRVVLTDTETIRGWGSASRFGGPSFSDDRDEVRRWFRRRFVSWEAKGFQAVKKI